MLGTKGKCEAAAHGLQYLFAFIFSHCSDHSLGLHVRETLAAKHVIRVCSAGENDCNLMIFPLCPDPALDLAGV